MNIDPRTSVIAFLSGTVFAVGLGVGGMTQPEKVIGFLDFFGSWDPALAFVMFGAVLTYGIGYRMVSQRHTPFYALHFDVPQLRQITPGLVIGSGMFGVGWGIAGFCPGPALASIPTGDLSVVAFVASMALGMFIHHRLHVRVATPSPARHHVDADAGARA